MIKGLTQKDFEKLLTQQSKTILNAVDVIVEKRIEASEQRIFITVDHLIDRKLKASEERINAKLDKLISTLDKFLKRLTDIEGEFTIMKEDLNRMKRIIRDKLGVDLL